MKKVTTWVIAVLVVAAGALTLAVKPAQGCPGSAAATAQHVSSKPAASGSHRSFIIAVRMGWL
jgi:hypothetical protein